MCTSFIIISQNKSDSDSEEERAGTVLFGFHSVADLTAEPTIESDSDESEKSMLDPKEFILDYVDGDEKVAKKAMKFLDSFM